MFNIIKLFIKTTLYDSERIFLDTDKNNLYFSQLAQYEVEDKNSKKIGSPGDALFTNELKIDSLILFGGYLEEKMENLHLRKNIDPVVPVSVIDSIDDSKKLIHLKIAKSELKTANDGFVAQSGLIQYTKLKNCLFTKRIMK